jgi:hypothetical protein
MIDILSVSDITVSVEVIIFIVISEISGSDGDEFEYDSLLGCCAV